MKVKVSELVGPALDWAVAKCEGEEVFLSKGVLETLWTSSGWKPSTEWGQGGPITVRKRISIHYCTGLRDIHGHYVHAEMMTHSFHGYSRGHDEPLIAAMRCYVTSEFGDIIEVPDELL